MSDAQPPIAALKKKRGPKPKGERALTPKERMRAHRLRQLVGDFKQEKSVSLSGFALAKDFATLWGCSRDEAIDKALALCEFVKNTGMIPVDLAYDPNWPKRLE